MNRDFKGIWISKEIWLNKELSFLQKGLLAEIDSLYNNEHGGCYASNEYLAEFFGVKEDAISKNITELKRLGYIQQVSFDGRKRVLKSILLGVGPKTYPDQVQKPTPIYEERKEERKDNTLFENFWKLYPRKIAKGKTESIFNKLKKEEQEQTLSAIGKKVDRWCQDKTEIKFIPHPATWLNQRRREDEEDAKVLMTDYDLVLFFENECEGMGDLRRKFGDVEAERIQALAKRKRGGEKI